MYINELRDIRFSKDNAIKLLRGNIISRSTIAANTEKDKIEMKDVIFPLAARIFKVTDIDVRVDNDWIFVRNNDTDTLKKVYDHKAIYLYEGEDADGVTEDERFNVPEFEEPAPVEESYNPEVVMESTEEAAPEGNESSNDEEEESSDDDEESDTEEVSDENNNNGMNHNNNYNKNKKHKKKH